MQSLGISHICPLRMEYGMLTLYVFLLLGGTEEKCIKPSGTKSNEWWEPLDLSAGAACLAPADFFPQPNHYGSLKLSS